MNKFLIEYHTIITFCVEILAAVTGLICYNKYKVTAAKYFIIFLVLIPILEFIAYYTVLVRPNEFLEFLIGTKFEKNFWFSTSYWDVGVVMFFSFYFYKVLKNTYYKKIIKILGYTFFLFSVCYIGIFFNDFFNKFLIVIILYGALVILTCTIFYFVEILQSEKILNFYKSINFYISATIFLWWLIITPISFYDIYYIYNVGEAYSDLDFIYLRFFIYLFSNIFMYLTFTFALIWCKPQNN